jgi:Zn-dependent peptidase ImmA (M78 family)
LNHDLIAEALLLQCGIPTQLPIDVFALAGAVGVTRIIRAPIEEDGLVQRVGDDAVIVVSSDVAPTRARFTVAHEIGHLILCNAGTDVVAFRSRPTRDVDVERFCDAFAAALLMPRPWIDQNIGRHSGLPTLLRLADEAGVSLQALFIRVRQRLDRRVTLARFRRSATGEWRSYSLVGAVRGVDMRCDDETRMKLDALSGQLAGEPYRATLDFRIRNRNFRFNGDVQARRREAIAYGVFSIGQGRSGG